MKNISNQAIWTEECTKCPNCKETSWYVMKCDCGFTFCKECGVDDGEHSERTVWLECPNCGNSEMYF